jgi:NadR type nicotinamide-nucleotide adenylyltransferase
VDPERTHRPVSGTAIRDDPHGLRHFVPARVYRDLIANVVLLGAPSTGKTTLAQALADAYRTSWVPEYGRTYWERHQRDRRLTPEQLLEIARRHIEEEDARVRDANRFLFTDTNALTTAVFGREYHGAVSADLEALADAATRRYDLVLLCATDVPYADTPDREGPAHRATFQRRVVDDLHARRVPYVVVRGTVAERVAQVRAALTRFSKFGNPFDVVDGGRA